jgi:hypothetical protein
LADGLGLDETERGDNPLIPAADSARRTIPGVQRPLADPRQSR